MLNSVNGFMIDDDIYLLETISEYKNLLLSRVELIKNNKSAYIGNYVTGIKGINESLIYNKEAIAILYTINDSKPLVGRLYEISSEKFFDGNSSVSEELYRKYFCCKVKQKIY